MTRASSKIAVYLEAGQKRIFAGALDWPGWSRSGRDEASALAALAAYGPRYAKALRAARWGLKAPAGVGDLRVVGRLTGTMPPDLGAPDVAPAGDARPVDEAELKRLSALRRASWRAFDAAVAAATAAVAGGRE